MVELEASPGSKVTRQPLAKLRSLFGGQMIVGGVRRNGHWQIGLGDTRIEIFQYESPTPSERDPDFRVCDHGITHFCLSVTGIEDEYARLAEAGVEFNGPPIDLGASICVYGRDPFGNVIELKQQKP